MSRTIFCDACGKPPSPNLSANGIGTNVHIGNIEVMAMFSLPADLDFCHECRNQALAKLSAKFPPLVTHDDWPNQPPT